MVSLTSFIHGFCSALLLHLVQEGFQSVGHGTVFGGRSRYIRTQSRILYGLDGLRSESPYAHSVAALVEIGKILLQSINSGGTEEKEQIVVAVLSILKIIADGAEHHGLGDIQTMLLEHRCVFVVYVGNREQQFLLLVLVQRLQQLCVVELACGSE